MGAIEIVVAALLLSSQSPPSAPAQEPPSAASVAGFAAFLQEDLPQRFGAYTVVSARAEGDLLIFTLDGRRGWRRPDTNVVRATEMLGAFCEQEGFREIISLAAVRVDTTERGADLIQGTPVTDCPPARSRRN